MSSRLFRPSRKVASETVIDQRQRKSSNIVLPEIAHPPPLSERYSISSEYRYRLHSKPQQTALPTKFQAPLTQENPSSTEALPEEQSVSSTEGSLSTISPVSEPQATSIALPPEASERIEIEAKPESTPSNKEARQEKETPSPQNTYPEQEIIPSKSLRSSVLIEGPSPSESSETINPDSLEKEKQSTEISSQLSKEKDEKTDTTQEEHLETSQYPAHVLAELDLGDQRLEIVDIRRTAQNETSKQSVISDSELRKRIKAKRFTRQYKEDFYRASYADVRLAIFKGQFRSGWEHFLEYGKAEGRSMVFSDQKHEFDEFYYLKTYPDVLEAVLNGKYRSGAHHYSEVGYFQRLKKNRRNYELLPSLSLTETDVSELAKEEYPSAIGEFEFDFRPKGEDGIEARLSGALSGLIYPSVYLDMINTANNFDAEARIPLKDAIEPLYNLRRSLEESAAKVLQNSELLSEFELAATETAEQITLISDLIFEEQSREIAEQQKEEVELDFLRSFQEKWKEKTESKSDDSPLSKIELFGAVQEANQELEQDEASEHLLQGLRAILQEENDNED